MFRKFAVALALTVIGATPALAQHPGMKPAAKSDTILTQLLGVWEGSVYSDHAPESPLKLTFTRTDALKVTASIKVNDQEFVTSEATNLKLDGNSVTWTQGVMDQSCKVSGVLIAGALKGDIACGEHGITYLARKKP